jgi:hypothetical protein
MAFHDPFNDKYSIGSSVFGKVISDFDCIAFWSKKQLFIRKNQKHQRRLRESPRLKSFKQGLGQNYGVSSSRIFAAFSK